ncbi:MAG TPA: hypothetical protein VMH84_13610 [Xanthobacteraceae bacterium]|nr:hypothetical protein [Xanthobacteraceae bacterium]
MRSLTGRTICALIATACLTAPQARAQDANTLPGEYCLSGVREVGSCMRLSGGGKWEYFLSYGAYDEQSEGTWKAANGAVVVDSLPYDRPATFSFKRLQKSESGAYTILVVGKGGDRGLAGIDVVVSCDGATKTGYTQYYGLQVDCAQAPTAVALGLRMFGLAPQRIDVASRAGTEKGYVFEFEPGDLGKRKFTAHRLQVGSDGSLTMVYPDSPIREFAGRPFRYERQRR